MAWAVAAAAAGQASAAAAAAAAVAAGVRHVRLLLLLRRALTLRQVACLCWAHQVLQHDPHSSAPAHSMHDTAG
jgi:hypothetical protein